MSGRTTRPAFINCELHDPVNAKIPRLRIDLYTSADVGNQVKFFPRRSGLVSGAGFLLTFLLARWLHVNPTGRWQGFLPRFYSSAVFQCLATRTQERHQAYPTRLGHLRIFSAQLKIHKLLATLLTGCALLAAVFMKCWS